MDVINSVLAKYFHFVVVYKLYSLQYVAEEKTELRASHSLCVTELTSDLSLNPAFPLHTFKDGSSVSLLVFSLD